MRVFKIIIAGLCFGLAACSSPEKRSGSTVKFGEGGEAGKAGRDVTQSELQEDIQRLASAFNDRVGQAVYILWRSENPKVRVEGLRQGLFYASASVDIATEPSPEAALLDFMVFILLSRRSLERYWIPEVLGDKGKWYLSAFDQTEKDVWAVADKVMSPTQQDEVRVLVTQWIKDNPKQIRVEGVRLSTFSEQAGRLEAEHASGLLSSVSSAVEVGDQALMFADRAMYLAQKMPFLIRMQAQLATVDILGPSGPVIEKAGASAREGKLFAESLYPIIPMDLPETIGTADRLAGKTLTIVQTLRAATPEAVARVDRLMRHAFFYFSLAAVLLAVVWWTGYLMVKRSLMRPN